jgi:hypothetical protein
LDIKDIIELRIGDFQMDEKEDRKVFVILRREYANSATQIYTFPLFPYEALLVNRYIREMRNQNPARVEPNCYLLSADTEGMEKMPVEGFNAFVRNLLMMYTIGYASRLGDVDLSKQHGIELLKATYRHRLEEYCGVSEQTDGDALTFLTHRSLAGHVQGDHYRSFTDSYGRDRLLGYVWRDQRFIPQGKGLKQILRGSAGDYDVITFRNREHGENRRIVLTFTASENGVARFRAPYGAAFQVSKPEYEDKTQGSRDTKDGESRE